MWKSGPIWQPWGARLGGEIWPNLATLAHKGVLQVDGVLVLTCGTCGALTDDISASYLQLRGRNNYSYFGVWECIMYNALLLVCHIGPDFSTQSGNPGLGVRAHKGVLQVKGVGVNMWMMWSSH